MKKKKSIDLSPKHFYLKNFQEKATHTSGRRIAKKLFSTKLESKEEKITQEYLMFLEISSNLIVLNSGCLLGGKDV